MCPPPLASGLPPTAALTDTSSSGGAAGGAVMTIDVSGDGPEANAARSTSPVFGSSQAVDLTADDGSFEPARASVKQSRTDAAVDSRVTISVSDGDADTETELDEIKPQGQAAPNGTAAGTPADTRTVRYRCVWLVVKCSAPC